MYLTKRGTTLNGDMDRHTIVMNRERPDGVTIWRLGKFLFAKVHRILFVYTGPAARFDTLPRCDRIAVSGGGVGWSRFVRDAVLLLAALKCGENSIPSTHRVHMTQSARFVPSSLRRTAEQSKHKNATVPAPSSSACTQEPTTCD